MAMPSGKSVGVAICLATLAPHVAAQDTGGQNLARLDWKGVPVGIIQTLPESDLSRCADDCLPPLTPHRGIIPVAEAEVIGFLRNQVTEGTGLLIDVRSAQAYAAGSIPGALNIPLELLSGANPYRADILKAFGAMDAPSNTLDFATARSVLVFGDGPLDPDAASAASQLVQAGYPARQILYYRGGLQSWRLLGLNVEPPKGAPS